MDNKLVGLFKKMERICHSVEPGYKTLYVDPQEGLRIYKNFLSGELVEDILKINIILN